jgi:hypothetical protein
MISGLKDSSRRRQDETQHRREGAGRLAESYRPSAVQNPRELEAIPERDSSMRSREREGYSIRQSSMAGYDPRTLLDRPERAGHRTDRYGQDPREMPVHRYSESMDNSSSQYSTLNSPWSGSPASQRSRQSSWSTAPSSVQGFSDERRRDLGHEATQYAPRRSSTIHHSGLLQGPPAAVQSYTDRRLNEKIPPIPRQVGRDRPAPGEAMQPDDDPPDWDETPNFRSLPRRHERHPDDDPTSRDETPNFRGLPRRHERRLDDDPTAWDQIPYNREPGRGHEKRRNT